MSYVPDKFKGAGDLHIKGLAQVIEENLKREQKKRVVVVQDPRYQARAQAIERRSDALIHPKIQDFWNRKMIACGLDPEDPSVHFPTDYPYLDTKNSVDKSKYEETYPPGFITILANAWEYDIYIQRALDSKASLVTNKGEGITIKVEPHTNLKLQGDEEAEKFLNENFIPKDKREDLMHYLDNVVSFTNLYYNLQDALIQKWVFGRGGVLVRKIKKEMIVPGNEFDNMGFIEGTPAWISPLSTPAMGRIMVDERSWTVSRLYYNDAIFGKDKDDQDIPGDWIKKEDMIYFVNKNYHMLPNRLHYGFSDLTTIIPLSESLRQIYTEVLQEANLNLVLPSIMFTFDDVDESTIAEFVQNYRAGGIMGRNTNVAHEVLDFAPNLDQVLHELDYIKKMLNYGCGIPPIFSGSEELTNRSIADRIAEVWIMTDLVPIRQQFSAELYDQFYLPTIKNWLQKEVGDEAFKNFVATKIRVVTEFPTLDFSDPTQRSNYLHTLQTDGIATLGEVRKLAMMDPYPDDMVEAMIKVEKKLKNNPDFAEELLNFINGKNMMDQVGMLNGELDPATDGKPQDPELVNAQKQINETRKQVDKKADDTIKKVANNRF